MTRGRQEDWFPDRYHKRQSGDIPERWPIPQFPSAVYATTVTSALEGFLRLECDEQIAGWLRAEVHSAQGTGYDQFGFNLFEVELFYGENRVTIREAAELGYEDAELTMAEFLAAIPNVPLGPRMPGRPKRVFEMPPASDA